MKRPVRFSGRGAFSSPCMNSHGAPGARLADPSRPAPNWQVPRPASRSPAPRADCGISTAGSTPHMAQRYT